MSPILLLLVGAIVTTATTFVTILASSHVLRQGKLSRKRPADFRRASQRSIDASDARTQSVVKTTVMKSIEYHPQADQIISQRKERFGYINPHTRLIAESSHQRRIQGEGE